MLGAVCEKFAKDYLLWRHGLPDLMLQRAEGEEAMFVEVKGPGDSLSFAQIAWIDVLLRAGGNVEVCHLR